MTPRARILLIVAAMLTPFAIYGVTGGGYPSRPTFQSVFVNGNSTTKPQIEVINSSAGASYDTVKITNGPNAGLHINSISTGSGIVQNGVDGYGISSYTTGTGPAGYFQSTGTGYALDVPQGLIRYRGNYLPYFSFGQCNAAGGLSGYSTQNIASCTNSGGVAIVVFTQAYTGPGGVCVTSANSVGSYTVTTSSAVTTQVQVRQWLTTTGVLTSTAFNILCFGII